LLLTIIDFKLWQLANDNQPTVLMLSGKTNASIPESLKAPSSML
jgi:hypothetical protein